VLSTGWRPPRWRSEHETVGLSAGNSGRLVRMRFWVVKGKPSRNDLQNMLSAGGRERWSTKKPPRDWADGDGVFIWEAAPALRVIGLACLVGIRPPNSEGTTFFELMYLTGAFDAPLGIAALRSDAALRDASFLKAGAAGTVFPLSAGQADRLLALARMDNTFPSGPGWDAGPKVGLRAAKITEAKLAKAGTEDLPNKALSIKQPWSELILRGDKTIEARSRRTHVRGRIQIYASLGGVSPEHQARVLETYGVDTSNLPRGLLVGSVEIVDCRPLSPVDSRAAGFPVDRGTTDFAWVLEKPRRARELIKPDKHPQPVFFNPF
jgi:ASCH domain-containing protein